MAGGLALDGKVVLVLVGIVFVPLLVVAVDRSLLFTGFIAAFSQILEPFEIDVAVASLSIGTIVLATILVTHRARLQKVIGESTHLRMLSVASVVFVGVHGLEFLHAEASLVLRHFVTLTSFMGFWLVGVSIGGTGAGRRGLALGAYLALIVLGILAIGVAVGIVPPPARVSVPRALFGFVSPFERNYGLNVGFNSTALLLPLTVPYLSRATLRGRLNRRISSAAAYVTLIVLTLLVFQSRSMIIEIALGLLVVAIFMCQSMLTRSVLALAIVFGSIQLAPAFGSSDPISSQLRSDSYSYVATYLRENRSTLLIGANVSDVKQGIESASSFGALVGAAPVHNFFLQELLSAGLFATATLGILFLVPAWRAIRCRDDSRYYKPLVLSAIVIALVEVTINPAEANVSGLWLALGSMAAMTANFRIDAQGGEKIVEQRRRLLHPGNLYSS